MEHDEHATDPASVLAQRDLAQRDLTQRDLTQRDLAELAAAAGHAQLRCVRRDGRWVASSSARPDLEIIDVTPSGAITALVRLLAEPALAPGGAEATR